ncbi:MAG: hypothetical protein WBD53_05265 [Xanthobacteraceae bacterium]
MDDKAIAAAATAPRVNSFGFVIFIASSPSFPADYDLPVDYDRHVSPAGAGL